MRFRPKTRRRGSSKKLDSSLFVNKATQATKSTLLSSEQKFSDYDIAKILKENIATHGYTSPTPIQEQAIPHLLEGKDLTGIADTGTGKTAAFLIALINKCLLDKTQKVLIIAPTRELALQITEEFNHFARKTGIFAAPVVGGTKMRGQIRQLRKKPRFVIATPGRLKDVTQRRELDLQSFNNIVLDEVDRMVDIGFVKDIESIIAKLPTNRQSIFFSATINKKAQSILEKFVTNAVNITVRKQNNHSSIEQDIVKPKNNQPKIDALHDLLIKPGFEKVMIFGKTKWGTEKLSKALIHRGFKTAAIHGNKSQNQRQRVLRQFKDNSINILVATDVASRGLDIDNVTHVINYDAPETYEDYVHRIGRTGRAGKQGSALTFVD